MRQAGLRRQVTLAGLGFALVMLVVNAGVTHLLGRVPVEDNSVRHQVTDFLLLQGTVVVSVGLLIWLLGRLVFRRLAQLHLFVQQLEHTPLTAARLRFSHRSDELEGAAQALNRLLDRLKAEHDQQRAQSDVLRLMAENATIPQVLAVIRAQWTRQYPGAQVDLLPPHPTEHDTVPNAQTWTVPVRGRAGERYGYLRLTFPDVLPDNVTSEAAWVAELLGVAVEQERLRTELSRHAYHDELTGLLNRPGLLRALKRHLEQAGAPHEKAPLVLLHLNLDRFKRVNDLLGHAAGDDLLRQTARLLQGRAAGEGMTGPGQADAGQSGWTGWAARLGADEFILAAYDPQHLAHEDQIAAFAQALCAQVQAPRTLQGQVFQPSVSIGVSLLPHDATDPESLLRYAALATDQVKRGPDVALRRRVAHFTPALHDALVDRLQLERDLREALAGGGFSLAYQPQVALGEPAESAESAESAHPLPPERMGLEGTGIKGFEALLRWTHPRRGVVPPATFIPVAEEAGLITELGHWVLREVARQAAQWRAQGITAPIAVNISAAQLLHPDIVPRVQALLREYGLPPQALALEVTESLLMDGAPGSEAYENLARLAALGLSVAVDDFGTGYSSLSYLHRLPIQTVKIDRSFVADLPGSLEALRIVETIVRLSHQLNLDVVAEGVEHPEQAALLARLGCQGAQGYLYARPMPAAQIPGFLAALTAPAALDAATPGLTLSA